jgi:hypothetical protein
VTGEPTPTTLPAASAFFQTSLRPTHSSANTWMSLLPRAFSMVMELPGRLSVLQP